MQSRLTKYKRKAVEQDDGIDMRLRSRRSTQASEPTRPPNWESRRRRITQSSFESKKQQTKNNNVKEMDEEENLQMRDGAFEAEEQQQQVQEISETEEELGDGIWIKVNPIEKLQSVFYDMDISGIENLSPGAGLYAMANFVIENSRKFPKKKKAMELPIDELEPQLITDEMTKDIYFKGKLFDAFLEDFSAFFDRYRSRPCSSTFDKELCSRLLCQHFPRVRTPFIEVVVEKYAGRYAPAAWMCLFIESEVASTVRQYFKDVERNNWVIMKALLPESRKQRPNWLPNPAHGTMAESIDEFQRDLLRFRNEYPQLFQEALDRFIPDADYFLTPESSKIECLVCFRALPLRRTVSCSPIDGSSPTVDVHQFCVECLVGYARAAMQEMPLAKGGVGLPCMVDCPNALLFSKCRFYIPTNVRRHLNARILEENVGAVKLENLEKCQHCNFAMIIDLPKEELRVFSCLRCKAEHCRACRRPWDDLHIGRLCIELSTELAQQRNAFEQQLSEAIIRRCHCCSLPFVKAAGCNKVVCRCGAAQCYHCRKAIANKSSFGRDDYSHFCDHFRDPVKRTCRQCSKCSLYDFGEDDEMDKIALVRVMEEWAMNGM